MGLKQTIIVKPITNEERKENGIYIPIKYEENLYRYEVIRSGVGELPEGLNKGDVIFTRSTNGCNVDLHGETVKVINRNEIIAIDG
jgi:co-chaperonin GroES (HSP10)